MPDFPTLIDNETVLWEGQPDTKLRFGLETMATGLFAAALILACLGLATVINRSIPGSFWAIFAPGVVVAAIVVLFVPWMDSRKRGRTAYRLTNKRAIIQVGTANQSYALPKPEALVLRDGTPPTVTFARLPGNRRVSFERISDGVQVHDMMRDLVETPT